MSNIDNNNIKPLITTKPATNTSQKGTTTSNQSINTPNLPITPNNKTISTTLSNNIIHKKGEIEFNNTVTQHKEPHTSTNSSSSITNSIVKTSVPFVPSPSQGKCLKRQKINLDCCNVLNIPTSKIIKLIKKNTKTHNERKQESRCEELRVGVSSVMERFIERCVKRMEKSNRKTLLLSDLKHVASSCEEFIFLEDLFNE